MTLGDAYEACTAKAAKSAKKSAKRGKKRRNFLGGWAVILGDGQFRRRRF